MLNVTAINRHTRDPSERYRSRWRTIFFPKYRYQFFRDFLEINWIVRA